MRETSGSANSPEMRVVPCLSVHDGFAALDFYGGAFRADTTERYDFDGKLGHATMSTNGGIVILADEFPHPDNQIDNVSPKTLGNRTTSTINSNVDDADAWFERAVAAGARRSALAGTSFSVTTASCATRSATSGAWLR